MFRVVMTLHGWSDWLVHCTGVVRYQGKAIQADHAE